MDGPAKCTDAVCVTAKRQCFIRVIISATFQRELGALYYTDVVQCKERRPSRVST